MKQITCPHCADTYPDFDVAHVCSKGPYAPQLKSKMNERIKQLAEQAEKYADANFKDEHFWTQAYESKFAELIIKECADTLLKVLEDDRMQKSMDPEMFKLMKNIGGHYSIFLRGHFGIE